MMYYEIDDTITYRRPDGVDVRAVVIARCDSLINGQPGLVGTDQHGRRTYALDSEIIGVSPTVAVRRRQQIAALLIAARQHDRNGENDVAETYRREADRLIEQAEQDGRATICAHGNQCPTCNDARRAMGGEP